MLPSLCTRPCSPPPHHHQRACLPAGPLLLPPQENLLNWLGDKFGRDQYVMRHGDNTAICWNDGKRTRADMAHQREFWTESFVQFSPQVGRPGRAGPSSVSVSVSTGPSSASGPGRAAGLPGGGGAVEAGAAGLELSWG